MRWRDPGGRGAGASTRLLVVVLAAGTLLAGCLSTRSAADEATAVASISTADATSGGDGSPIRLDALTARDLEDAALSGELACGFSTDDGARILFAMGLADSEEPAGGVVKVSGHVERIGAPGGFDGIVEDPTFTGRGKTIRIAVVGPPAVGGGESPPRPATLTYHRADGASRSFDGHWRCGP